MNKLKPCPFCGSTDIDYGVYTGTMRGFDYVQCQECGAEIHAAEGKEYLKEVIERWNRRADNGK